MLEALLLGLVQGFTEFLPISSSAHLTLLPKMAGWNSPLLNSLAFDVALHAGTLVAVVIFFWKDLIRLLRSSTAGIVQGKPFENPDSRLAWLIVLGTIPAVAAAVLFGDMLEQLGRHPVWVASLLIGFGLLMALAEFFAVKKKKLPAMNTWEALTVGVGQALALFPGVSRSGATITTGLILRYERAEAARFAFLLSIPAILGAVVFEGRNLMKMALDQSIGILAVGVAASAISGYACIRWLIGYLQRRTLYPFVIYRLVLGAVVLWWAFEGSF